MKGDSRDSPGYRGKRESFDPAKVGRKAGKSWAEQSEHFRVNPTEQGNSNRAPNKTLPSKLLGPQHKVENVANPTPQKNENIWEDAIFGIDVTLTELDQRTEHTPSYARLPEITRAVYTHMMAEDDQITKKLVPEMIHYYSTALLWTRLLDIKAKRATSVLTDTEREYRRCFVKSELHVPQPLYLFLRGIGHVAEKCGKLIYLADHALPVAQAGNRTGYFSEVVNADTHNLYEEQPTLGVAGDVLMALASAQDNPQVEIPIMPVRTRPTKNLVGFTEQLSPRRVEIRQFLAAVGIQHNAFSEIVPSTRLNWQLVLNISEQLGKFSSFRMEKVRILDLTVNVVLWKIFGMLFKVYI